MKLNVRRILFTSALVVILVAISVVCFVVGRGHTVYLDNKSIEGTDYSSYASITIVYKGEEIVTLEKTERGSIAFTGQKLDVQFKAKKTNAAMEETIDVSMDIPYNLDGIIINIPAYLSGADEDVYMSEFVPAQVEESTDEEVPVTDEFGMTSEDE